MNIVLGVCTHAERRHASRIGIGRNFRLLSAATVVTVEGSLLLSANTMKYKPRFASIKKKADHVIAQATRILRRPERITSYRYRYIILSLLQFPGECILTYMEFQLDSAEYCQAQHK